MKCQVTMERIERRQHDFVVEVEKAQELAALGERLAADHNYHDDDVTDVEYRLVSWCEVDENGDEKEELADFSVVFGYPDDDAICIEYVAGKDWRDALQRFFHDPEHGDARRNYAQVIAMLPGRHQDVMDAGIVGDGPVNYEQTQESE